MSFCRAGSATCARVYQAVTSPLQQHRSTPPASRKTVHDVGALSELYDNLSEVARDTAGTRYSATLRDGTPVDICVLAPSLSARIRDGGRFLETLERASRVRHPGLCELRAWRHTPGGLTYLVCSRVGGPIPPGGRGPDDIAAVGIPLARAVAAAHDQGFIHGAISVDRVSATPDGGAALGGLGLYQALRDAGLDARDALPLATPQYLSPEQHGGSSPTQRSDVYSLGAVLYELLTGKPPFGGRTTSYVMASVLSDSEVDPETPPANVRQGIGPAVDAVLRAIERAPEDRWPSMAAFADALDSQTAKPGAAKGRFSRLMGRLSKRP